VLLLRSCHYSLPSLGSYLQGPPFPLSTTKKNVIIIGDSVSLGYTGSLAKNLSDIAIVQHAPWSGDGGAEETAYGVQCLDFYLRSPSGEAYEPDVRDACIMCSHLDHLVIIFL
jgi:hypothetical protein